MFIIFDYLCHIKTNNMDIMNRSFLEAIAHRRSYYSLKSESPISDKEIENIVCQAVKHVPSPFNNQSTRVVILFGKSHIRLWDIVKETLAKIVPAEAFKATEQKINNCFAAGYASLLFYEDQNDVRSLQEKFPSYAANFPIWSEQTCGMHQFAIWTALEDAGLGASLQHYNPLIDKALAAEFGINPDWKLIAQMPFGAPGAEPGDKDFKPIDERVKVIK